LRFSRWPSAIPKEPGRCSPGISRRRERTTPSSRRRHRRRATIRHAATLIALFERHPRRPDAAPFFGPKILESLYVLGDAAALPLYEELLVAGHTDPHFDRCEVTRALVGVRAAHGTRGAERQVPDPAEPHVIRALDEAARLFEEERDRLVPVVVI